MSYTALSAAGVVLTVLVDLLVLRTRLVRRKAFWTAYAILACFQLAFNGVLTGRGVVRYRASDILGLRLAYAPVEDLGFGFTLILLTLSVWVYLGRRQDR
ncbi:MAG TPA: lycopene cyclase domain-containing protein [Jatrophihabitans sp.]|nr:lycopene cyclase domain-containing protein [Jatrophihabitans sp.]